MANDIIVFCAHVAQDRETCSVSYSHPYSRTALLPNGPKDTPIEEEQEEHLLQTEQNMAWLLVGFSQFSG